MANKRDNIIQVGDVVTLKSGGPKMIVSELQGHDKNAVNVGEQHLIGNIRCVWHDEGGRMQTAVFPLAAVEGSDEFAGIRSDRAGSGQSSDFRAGADDAAAGREIKAGASADYRSGYAKGDRYPRDTPAENRPDAPLDPARDASRYPDRSNPGQVAPDAYVAPHRAAADRQSDAAPGAIGSNRS